MDVNYMKYETLEEEYITMNELMKQSDKNKTDFTKPVPESVSLFVQNNNDLERQYNQPVYEKTVRPPPGFEHLSPHHPSQNQPKSLQKNFQQQQQQPPQSQQQPQQPPQFQPQFQPQQTQQQQFQPQPQPQFQQPPQSTMQNFKQPNIINNYYLCPVCNQLAISTCNCQFRDAYCSNGHNWYYYNGNKQQGLSPNHH